MPNSTSSPSIVKPMGFDYGHKRIGVAIGQGITNTATPVAIVNAKNGEPCWQEIQKLIQKWRPSILLIGMPLHMDGAQPKQIEAIETFKAQLQQHCDLDIEYVDERLTTQEARSQLREKDKHNREPVKKVDAYAACLIVQSWLNEH